ncbi:MAG: MMPL family transporter [Pirellulaceae bacterium]
MVRRPRRPVPTGAVVGEPVLVDQGSSCLSETELGSVSAPSLLLALVLLVTFRSWRWVLISGIVVQCSLAIVKLFLALTGAQLTMVSAMFGSVVTVIAVAAIMHWIVRFREQQQLDDDRERAFRKTLEQILAPTFWACATDAAGFAALMVASVEPVQDFGVLMIVGTACVFGSLIFSSPRLVLLPLPGRLAWLDSVPHQSVGSTWLDRRLESLLDSVRAAPRRWALCVLLVVGGMTLGLTRVTVESDFTKNFRASSQIAREYRFVEERLGEPAFGKSSSRWMGHSIGNASIAYESSRTDCERRWSPSKTGGSEPGLVQVFSIADGLVGILPFDLEKLPVGKDLVVSQGMQQFEARMPGLLANVVARDEQHGLTYVRVLLRSKQQMSAEDQEAIIEQVKQVCRDESARWPGAETPLVTGWYVLLARIVDHLLADQVLTLAVATVGIFVLVWWATGSLVQALLALVPNLLPIGAVLGTLGWLGVPINMGVALIAAVSVGLSIDSTIHYLDVVKRRRKLGMSEGEALSAAQHRAGSASIFSTIALTAGFATMVGSEFLPTVYFGLLVCAAMLGGLIGNLLVLPLLLVTFDAREPKAPSMLS